jgi:PPM family protein phosphatase
VIVESWALSDVGKQRTANEDCLFVDPENQLMLVLDGMGGHRAGEVASRLAMETIADFFKGHANGSDVEKNLFEDYDHSFTFHTNLLRQATFTANRVVLEKSLEKEDFVGMGCTVAGMVVRDFSVSVINVGDSRLYLIRNGTIEQVSKDHTLAEDQVERGIMSREEARESQLKHILSSVIGVDTRIRVHIDELTVLPGDIFLLCSDGLTAVMTDEEILDEIVKTTIGQETLDRLISIVNGRGGPDNTTLVLSVFSEESSASGEDPDDKNLGIVTRPAGLLIR